MDELATGAPSPLDEALGIRVVELQDDRVVLRFDPAPLTLGGEEPRPFLHGGALSTCVDTGGWAAVYHASPGEWLAIDLRCDFLRIAGLEPLRVTGRCLRAGRTLASANVEITPWDDPERLLTVGRVQFLRVPAAKASS